MKLAFGLTPSEQQSSRLLAAKSGIEIEDGYAFVCPCGCVGTWRCISGVVRLPETK